MTVPVVAVSKAVQTKLDACTTTVDKIRLLTKEGVATADIARKIGKLYQHVWNEQDRIKRSPKK